MYLISDLDPLNNVFDLYFRSQKLKLSDLSLFLLEYHQLICKKPFHLISPTYPEF